MKVIEEFTTVKSLAEVFNYIAVNYFENHPKFDPEVHKMIWRTEPPVVKGTKGSEQRSFAGVPVKLDFEVIEFDRPKVFAFKNTSGPFLLERSYKLESQNGGTKVTFSFDIKPKNALIAPAFQLMKKKFKKSVHHNIGLLKGQLR